MNKHIGCLPMDTNNTVKKHESNDVLNEQDYHELIDKYADELEDKIIDIRHHIHRNPELSNREFNTAKLIADYLREIGLDEVKTEVGFTGVVGILKGEKESGKCIALRADFDALPIKEVNELEYKSNKIDEDYPGGPFPVGHLCGHDAHTTMLLGAAEILTKLRKEISGTVKFLFQPAEEGPPVGEEGGASLMIKEGALTNPKPDMAFAIHSSAYPVNTLYYTRGATLAASELFKITIKGMGVHGSTPWMGKDPLTVAAEVITAFGQIYRQVPATEPITISVGKIDDTGRFNVIGENIVLWGTVRAINQNIMTDINTRLVRISQHIAMAHGLTADVSFDQSVPAVYNQDNWLDRVLPSMERIFGSENMHSGPPMMAYDDHSFFQLACGGVYLFLGCQDTKWTSDGLKSIDASKPIPFNHNPQYYVKDEALKTGMRMHASVAMDFLNGLI